MEQHQGSIAVAACALAAAASGVLASSIDAAPPPIAYALTPQDLTEWTKAICNNLFTIVNTIIGLYNLIAIGQSTVKRRKAARHGRTKPTPSDGPAPHTEPSEGASH